MRICEVPFAATFSKQGQSDRFEIGRKGGDSSFLIGNSGSKRVDCLFSLLRVAFNGDHFCAS